MVGRRKELNDEGQHLAIRTDVRAKALARNHVNATDPNDEVPTSSISRTASLDSVATSADEQVHTHLSASSAGNTDISCSGFSSSSTAPTSTMTDDDRPSASSPLSPAPHAHPTVTVLELVSDSASSSALPDSFGFHISRKGGFIAVSTASNIWLIKSGQLPRLWARTLQVKRKPVAIDITEDGQLLAVLSRPSQVDLYEIQGELDRQIKKRRTISLVHEATSLVISPDSLILITGNNYGIEVVSIGVDAPESCRRTLSGPVGDILEFSDDGRTLLITGYARKSGGSSMFVLPGLYDGPLDEEGFPTPAAPEAVWTGLVLFPETAKIARQATLLPDADTGSVNELFAFNSDEDSWGIYDIAAQRFTDRKLFLPDQQRWTRSEFLDDAMPAISPKSDLAAVALKMRGTTSIWIYQIPEWDFKPKSPDMAPIQPCFCIPILHDEADANQEISVLRWVKMGETVQRLVAAGNMNTAAPDESEGPSLPQGSKGVIIVLDFDKSKPAGAQVSIPTKTEYDLDPLLPGERLPEGSIDFEREVELVRTRTIAQRRAQERSVRRNSRHGSGPGRARTTATRDNSRIPQPAVPVITTDDEEGESLTLEEAQAAFEAPYAMAQPRSQNSLARAATVAAVSPANRRHLRALPFRPLEYRRADGLREFPHESDADNWVPPPPAYTATAEAAHSVSLSHPASNGPQASSSGIPPVPSLPGAANALQSRAASPYHHHQSQSSTDLSTLTPPPSRPSLLHPSTYPSPQSPASGRRRSSSAQAHYPPPHIPAPPPQQQTAYQATTNTIMSGRRPSLRVRRAVGSNADLRSVRVADPAAERRGSAPANSIPRRPVQTAPTPSPVMSQETPRRSNFRRAMLPRLTTPVDSRMREPMSAPPRTESRMARFPLRPETRASVREKKRINCVVM